MNPTATIRVGDSLAVLRGLAPDSVNCCVTSPPYWGLRDYGVEGQIGLEETFEQFLARLVGVFREVRRVLRPDGLAWINMGDGFCQAQKGGNTYSGFNERYDGTGIGGKQSATGSSFPKMIRRVDGLKPKDLIGQPWRLAFALQADGWWLRSDCIWHKPNPMPESITDRPTKAHEYVFLLTKSARYFYDAEAVREDGARYSWSVQKFKGGDLSKHHASSGSGEQADPSAGRNLRTVWTIASQPYAGAHFATFPEALAERCILSGCPSGGTVLDPFTGSGTTGAVAVRLGRSFVGAELNPEYAELARKRINAVQPLFTVAEVMP